MQQSAACLLASNSPAVTMMKLLAPEAWLPVSIEAQAAQMTPSADVWAALSAQKQITAKWGYPTTGDADLSGFKVEYMQLVVGGGGDVSPLQTLNPHSDAPALCMPRPQLQAQRPARPTAWSFTLQRPTARRRWRPPQYATPSWQPSPLTTPVS